MIKLAAQVVPLKVDAEKEGKELARKYKVQGFPTILFIDNQEKVVDKIVGYLPPDKFAERLTQIVGKYKPVPVEPEKDDAIDTKAKAELAKADKLRDEHKYNEALAIYDELGTKYAARATGKLANERARELRDDPKVMKQLESGKQAQLDEEAAKDSEQWLKVARQMAKGGNNDLARNYYQKIIDKYPKSKYAKTAQEEMGKLTK